jgi:signal transduction histidine kinase
MGLIQAVENDIDRFNRLKFLDAKLSIKGDRYVIPKKDVIILFRILQEFFNNTIKHSKATTLDVNIEYKPNKVQICAKDNGKGYDVTKVKKGSGLINMKSRANLIHTKIKFISDHTGTKIELTYKNKTQDET